MTIKRVVNDIKYEFELSKEELETAFKERLYINHKEDVIITLENECSYLSEKEKNEIIRHLRQVTYLYEENLLDGIEWEEATINSIETFLENNNLQ